MGGAMPVAHRVENGAMVGPDGARETPEEQDFFEALGLAWIPPQERLVDRLKATLRASRVA